MGPVRVIEVCWSTLVEIYKEFAVESTIHGIKYTITSRSTLARFFWVITLISSLIASVKLAGLFYDRHETASISTSIINDHYPTWRTALPAITLCPGSIAVAHKVHPYLGSQKRMYMPRGLTRTDFENGLKHLRESIHPQNHFPEELDKLQQILSANRLSLLELLRNVGPNCTDLLIACQFQGRPVPCERITRPIVTAYGVCCSFNYANPRDRSQSFTSNEFRTAYFGKNFALSVLLKSYPPEDSISRLMIGEGLKVLIHERRTHPGPTATQFVAAAGHETIARLDVKRLVSSSEILKLPAGRRGCRPSTRMSFYRADDCESKCRDTIVRKLCGCYPFFSTVDNPWPGCNLTHIQCISRIAMKLNRFTQDDPSCVCPPDCESTSYDVSIACSLPLNALRYNQKGLYKQAHRHGNVTLLHFTYAAQSGILQRRQLILPKINLVSSLGGVFSLFLGCSFVSLFEILYFFSVHVIRKVRSKLINPFNSNVDSESPRTVQASRVQESKIEANLKT